MLVITAKCCLKDRKRKITYIIDMVAHLREEVYRLVAKLK